MSSMSIDVTVYFGTEQLFLSTWQYTKHYILKAEQHFLDGVVAAELKNRLLPNEMYC